MTVFVIGIIIIFVKVVLFRMRLRTQWMNYNGIF